MGLPTKSPRTRLRRALPSQTWFGRGNRRRVAGGSSGSPAGPRPRRPFTAFLLRLAAIVLLIGLVWCGYVVHRINAVAGNDQAQPADAIAVFGAAEYSGRPSPVYHARLDHAVSLFERHIAPVIITLGGGSDKDSGLTEGGVGRDYLLANGVPFDDIIAETNSFDTRQQAERLAAIARERGFSKIVVVSDATHLFRIQQLCEQQGLDVYTSPRPAVGHLSDEDLAMRYWHEILSYTAMQLNLNSGWLHRLLVGKGDD